MKVEIDLDVAKELKELCRLMRKQLECAKGSDSYEQVARYEAHLLAAICYAQAGGKPSCEESRS